MIVRISRLLAAAILLAVAWIASPLTAVSARADGPVDLRLVLAVDASGSVNDTRFELQKRGYSAAFRHARVLKAIQSGPYRSIAVTMMQWTGPALQVQVVPWMRIGDDASMRAFADAVDAAPRRLFSGGTSISGAIDQGVQLLSQAPYSAPRSVIDVSGDGSNNRGRPASAARDEAVAAGIVINGLPILELDPTLDEHYLANVVGGPNSFVVPARSFDEFADAILKKLIIEIADLEPGRLPKAAKLRRVCDRC
ncbi:MAG: DUF1194 domain-containing protein [Hyphomicrobiaceae bacterium]|nr:DUF1194 domain-containing protein [Hyphomicrobiaceae bacterium]